MWSAAAVDPILARIQPQLIHERQPMQPEPAADRVGGIVGQTGHPVMRFADSPERRPRIPGCIPQVGTPNITTLERGLRMLDGIASENGGRKTDQIVRAARGAPRRARRKLPSTR
jgi:hypothetical protein